MELTPKQQQARQMVCLPLDGLNSLAELKARVRELSPVVGLFKIGYESYTRFGPAAVQAVHEAGAQVFLDLKYHDIPNTVRGAAAAATQLGVYLFNVHAAGGLAMLEAAVAGAKEAAAKYQVRAPKIIAVTLLTSLDQAILNQQLRVPGSVEEQVLHYAQLARQAGLAGIVCSATDLGEIRAKLPADFLYVTPGIKGPKIPAGADQKRVLTPGRALQAGAKILVVGRAITGPPTAEARIQAGLTILTDLAQEL